MNAAPLRQAVEVGMLHTMAITRGQNGCVTPAIKVFISHWNCVPLGLGKCTSPQETNECLLARKILALPSEFVHPLGSSDKRWQEGRSFIGSVTALGLLAFLRLVRSSAISAKDRIRDDFYDSPYRT